MDERPEGKEIVIRSALKVQQRAENGQGRGFVCGVLAIIHKGPECEDILLGKGGLVCGSRELIQG
jgi:hypothetical protein